MELILYIVFFLSCLILIVAVLLQPGKTDAGALFTSGVSSAALNPRGTQSVLSKLTIAAATVFMLSALLLSLPAISGDRSVLDTESTVDPAAANTNANANANANADANSNANAESAGANTVVNASEPKKEANTDAADKGEASDKKKEDASEKKDAATDKDSSK